MSISLVRLKVKPDLTDRQTSLVIMSTIYKDIRENQHLSNRADDEYFSRVLISDTDDKDEEGTVNTFSRNTLRIS